METRVVLDANAYCETNYGRSGKFDSLIDFLKKTNARLVWLPSVLNEVLAKHERDYRTRIDAAKNSVKEAAKHCFTGRHPQLFQASPNFVLETKALKQNMLNVGKSVTVEYLQDCSGVDVLEVSRRGARRIPPADSNGEELRDVIHWLAILSYAKQNDARILFVSRDGGFWAKEGGVKEEILQDVNGAGRRIDLFKDIDDLLKQNSLSSKPLDALGGVDLFDISRVASPIIEMVGNSLNSVDLEDSTVEFRSGNLIESEFQTGTRYQVSTSSEFIEATFRVKVSAQISFRPKVNPISWSSMGVLAGSPARLSGLSGIRRPSESFDTIVFVDLSTRVVDQQVGLPEVDRIRFSKKDSG